MDTEIMSVVEVYDAVEGVWKAEFGDLIPNPGPTHAKSWLTPHELERQEVPLNLYTDDELVGPLGFVPNTFVFAVLGDMVGRLWHPPPVWDSPRGLPEDASAEVAILAERDEGAGCHSYLTLADLQAYDWNQPARYWARCESLREAHYMARLPLVIDRMALLGAPDRVRLVYWFT